MNAGHPPGNACRRSSRWRTLLKSPRGPVTEQSVADLREGGFSGEIVEIAKELAAD
jgi:hypothetical protein